MRSCSFLNIKDGGFMDKVASISQPDEILGVLLAGGASRRFDGGDKCFQVLDGTTLLDRAVNLAKFQTPNLILNANGEAGRFNTFDFVIVPDIIQGGIGPLAGVLTGMEWAKIHAPQVRFLATYAVDTPFFPDDLVKRLYEQLQENTADIAIATSHGRKHPVFALWSIALSDHLRHAIECEKVRKVMAWAGQHNLVLVDFKPDGYDPFFNINTQQDLNEAETLVKSGYFIAE